MDSTEPKLSLMLRASCGLTKVSLGAITENYKRALAAYIAQPSADKEVINYLKIYRLMAKIKQSSQAIQKEERRLQSLKLPPKTIERRLREDVQKGLVEPMSQLESMLAKYQDQSNDLSQCVSELHQFVQDHKKKK